MSPRVYVRKFDYGEAKRLRGTGMTWRALGERFGVSGSAVWFACNDDARAKMLVRSAAWQKGGVCPDCGGPATRQSRRNRRCVACGSIARATSAREGELQCAICREWKADDEFPNNRSEKYGRRGKHGQCRVCLTVAKRDWRRRNPGHEAATLRAYRAKRRAA